jgi:DNA invertase Pin-like site-specific DNA recombinase
MRTIGYLRISTQEQCPDRQIDGLAALCDELHLETLSAVSAKRPIFERVISELTAGNTLIVWDLGRTFRSTLDAITQAERLRARGVEFKIANLQVDTATPGGMLVYTVMSACAEFERPILIQRTKEGLAAARLRGKRLGRPPSLSPEQLLDAREKLQSGSSTLRALAHEFGVAPWTLTRALKKIGGSSP